MKRRNFFKALVALVTGVKAVPAAYSTTVTSRTPEELAQAALSQKHMAGAQVDSTGEWRRQMQALIKERREDPNALRSIPFPTAYARIDDAISRDFIIPRRVFSPNI